MSYADRTTEALRAFKAAEYSPDALRAMNDNLTANEKSSDRMVQALRDAGTSVLDIGTGLEKSATDQIKSMLAQESRAGMQLDPVTGQPIDPTGSNLAAIMDRARSGRDNATGFDMAGMVDVNALDQYQNKLAGDRETAAGNLRKASAETYTRSLDADNKKILKLKGEAAQQSLNINRWTEESRQLAAQLKQDLGEIDRSEKQERLDNLTQKIEYELENQLETNKGLKSSRLYKDAQVTSLGVTDTKESVLTNIQRENLKAKKRENKEAERIEKNAIEMAPQFEKITAAQAVDAKAGITDFAASAEFKEYNRLINLNRKNRRKNEALQGEFAERIKNLNLPITEEQLIKAGVRTNPLVDADGQPLEGEYDYSPSARSRLDKVLARAHGTTFGTQGTPTSAVLNQLGKGAIAQSRHLSVGFRDSADLAAKGKIARDTENFTEALKDKVKVLDDLDRGARTAKIKEFRKELTAMPGSTKEAMDTGFGQFSDEDLDFIKINLAPEGKWGKKDGIEPTDARFGKVKWDQKVLDKYDLSTINLKSKNTKKATFTSYEAHIVKKLKGSPEGRRASDSAINLKAGKMLALIPGYTTARKYAVIKQEAIDLVNKVNTQTDAVIAQQVADMRTSIAGDGHIAYMTGYLEKNHAKAFAGSQLEDMQTSLRGVIATAEELYYDKIHDPLTGKTNKAARAELYHAVLKMYTGSTGDSTWWWHNTTGPKGTNSGMLGSGINDTGIEDLTGDAFRSAISPHLPDALSARLSAAEKVRNLEKQIAILKKQGT